MNVLTLLILALSLFNSDVIIRRCEPGQCLFYVANLGPDSVGVWVEMHADNLNLDHVVTTRGPVHEMINGYWWNVGMLDAGAAASIFAKWNLHNPCDASLRADVIKVDVSLPGETLYVNWECTVLPMVKGVLSGTVWMP